MSSTEMRVRGADLKKMTDLEMRFCLHYVICWVGAEAVRVAGYKSKNPDVMAAAILKRPHIKAYIGKIKREDHEEFTIKRHEILWHLWACATRNGKQFVDKEGRLLLNSQNINDLPDEVTAAIDGIEQEETYWTDGDGVEHTKLKTKIKLASKVACIDMAMKNKGAYAAEVTEHKLAFDFDQLYFPPENSGETLDIQGEKSEYPTNSPS